MSGGDSRTRVVILGAAGRDFHNFNMLYRDDPSVELVAFTATQIPGISRRLYPESLAGRLYPDGIPILDEADLERICAEHHVERVEFAYSDLRHEDVMHLAARALATGADFELVGPARTMLRSARPVVAVSAIRTGCGKSQTAATSRRSAYSDSPRSPTSTPPTAPSRSARNMSPISKPAP